ncbi:MAG: tetraacyldisaccharide 4'-kinase [Acidobacteria bacterium]|nr:tetraacyldisaccharide 4'-kinase [Acidobacteriota bacterium]MBK7932108.1 tetraacyldisaccharide 4'-kinase [Acidobacteriota bacterium]
MLWLLGHIFGKVAELRNSLYDKGVLDVFDLRARVISVGNLTAGGTGKTPLVAYISNILHSRGETVCILTRGYGRKDPKERVVVTDGKRILTDAEHAGDEPFELAKKLLGKVIIIADADRVSAGEWARRKFGVTTFILDDGFQHRKVKRDLDIVCIDSTDPFGGGKMLPAGRLREQKVGLDRADVVIVTRANLGSGIAVLRSSIADLNPETQIFTSETAISGVVDLKDIQSKRRPTQREIKEHKVFAFCGIGNPEIFFKQLWQDGFDAAGTKAFRDHFVYSQKDVAEIERLARDSSADLLLTTAKDAVKLQELEFTLPCYVVEIEMVIDRPAELAALV